MTLFSFFFPRADFTEHCMLFSVMEPNVCCQQCYELKANIWDEAPQGIRQHTTGASPFLFTVLLLLTSFTMSDIQNGTAMGLYFQEAKFKLETTVGLIFRDLDNRWINHFESFKESVASVVNMEWAVPGWRPHPFCVMGFRCWNKIFHETTLCSIKHWKCRLELIETLAESLGWLWYFKFSLVQKDFLLCYWKKLMLHLEPSCWLHNHTQTTVPHCKMPPWPSAKPDDRHRVGAVSNVSYRQYLGRLPNTMRHLLSSFSLHKYMHSIAPIIA